MKIVVASIAALFVGAGIGAAVMSLRSPAPVKNAPRDSRSQERMIAFYRSPMDPKQTSPAKRKDEMGMDYVPVYEDELSGEGGPSELAVVTIDPERQQLIGVRTAEVTRGSVGGKWRTSGRVAPDETRVRHINVKVAGFIEQLFVDFVGKAVKKGDPLFAIYSPELYSAQQELLLAQKTRDALAQGGTLTDDGDDLLRSARRRLELWDVPKSEIERVLKTREPTKALVFTSPISGAVTKKDVVQGMRLEAGAMPLEITDLSVVWVLADVYETELRYLKLGMPAELTLKAFPGQTFRGLVSFIDPVLDPNTRTVKVRLTFANPHGDLRPEMFGEVVLMGADREALRIPTDAIIESGTETVAFVDLGAGKLAPRAVELGDSDGQNVEVLSGLTEGERVVTHANFLVDSESRLRASLSAMSAKP